MTTITGRRVRYREIWQRRALVLAAFGGRRAREISDIEGIPLGTAKTRIRAAMLRLRTELEVGHER